MSDPTLTDQPAAAPPEAAAPAGEPGSLETLLNEARAMLEEQRNAHLRALADADNARKRAQADIAAAGKYAVERIVADLLPVMDSLEAALATQSADAVPLRSGVELTLKQLRAALEKARVAGIEPAPGERFDPNRHQAMAAVESPPGEMREPNTIVAVMQKGYLLHERVVRPALVTVAKAVEKATTNPISDASLASNQGH